MLTETAVARYPYTARACNKNTIPNDPENPFVTSGIRLGTPAVTSRGLNTEDMDKVAEAICLVAQSPDNRDKARAIVKELTSKYPLVKTGIVYE